MSRHAPLASRAAVSAMYASISPAASLVPPSAVRGHAGTRARSSGRGRRRCVARPPRPPRAPAEAAPTPESARRGRSVRRVAVPPCRRRLGRSRSRRSRCDRACSSRQRQHPRRPVGWTRAAGAPPAPASMEGRAAGRLRDRARGPSCRLGASTAPPGCCGPPRRHGRRRETPPRCASARGHRRVSAVARAERSSCRGG